MVPMAGDCTICEIQLVGSWDEYHDARPSECFIVKSDGSAVMGIEEGSFSGIMSQTARELAERAEKVARGELNPNLIDRATYFTNLPQHYYTDQGIFDLEMEKIFSKQWLYAGHVSQLPNPGDYYVREIGPESMIIARDTAGRLRAYFNVCRHRGSRICKDQEAGNTKVFVCPYHRWSFGIDGNLKAAPGARNGREFQFDEWRLEEAHCDTYFGAIFVYLGDEAPTLGLNDFLSMATSNKEKLTLVDPERTKVVARREYIMKCNWKVMMENFGECYHCHGGHPTLSVSCNIQAGFLTDKGEVNPLAAGSLFVFNAGMKTISADGEWVCKRPLGAGFQPGFSEGYAAFPMFVGAAYHADYGEMIGVEPLTVDTARLYTEWFVHEDAVEGVDYAVDTLIKAWDVTNLEDVFLAENNYKGVRSRRFKPGPHVVNREAAVRTALTAYLDMMETDAALPA